MENIKVIDNGIEKKLSYNEKYANGIFIVKDNKLAKRNCELLNIELGENVDPNELKQTITKLEKTGLFTSRLLGEHFQCILKDYADKTDVEELISQMPQQSREALRNAYNLAKINTLGDLDFLGAALDNKN